MTRLVLRGVIGANPLGFLASLGLLRVVTSKAPGSRLGFLDDGSFMPFLDLGVDLGVASLVAADAQASAPPQTWRLEYEKTEKKGTKVVADLKAPPSVFKGFLETCIESWCKGEDEGAAYAAAFATSIAVDGKGNTKPTAFHFTAANQQFLGTLDEIRSSVTEEWVNKSLFEASESRGGSNLRWDPAAERNWALMANNPNDDGTSVDAPLEWLAFRGLALFPCYPIVPSSWDSEPRVATLAVQGRGADMRMSWPLWAPPASLETVKSLISVRWNKDHRERAARGIIAVCTSSILRTSQGFGNFSPATVEP